MADIVRLSINLAPDVAAELKRLAANKNVSVTEAVRRSIAIWSFWETQKAAGHTPAVLDSNGRAKEVVIL